MINYSSNTSRYQDTDETESGEPLNAMNAQECQKIEDDGTSIAYLWHLHTIVTRVQVLA